MTYNGNQVTSVTDASGSQNLYNTKEYYNKKDSLNEMSYDNNGNMIKDLDREIVTIRYNILNLPDTVQFKNGNQIINRYTADGSKLSTIYFTRVTAITSPIIPGKVCNWTHTPGIVIKSGMDIVTNLEYSLSGNTRYFSKVLNSEGYSDNVTSNSNFYIYHKDHLGSNRELIKAGYALNITQYYPSGLTWAEGNSYYAMPNKFNGKDFVEMHGFDTYDYGARGYYAAIGRFTTIDPLAESDYSVSPYAYCENNPVNRIDPDGRQTKRTDEDPAFSVIGNEVVIHPSGDAVIHQKDNTESRGSYWLFFGHGQGEEGDGYNVNAGDGLPRKTIFKGDDTGGTAGVDWLDKLQTGLDVAGIADPTGLVDLGNALIYAGRGQWGNAGISALAIIPYIGDLGKAGRLGAKATGLSYELINRVAKGADGGLSRHVIERLDGDVISKTHQVFKDGEKIHQHQNHIGTYGTIRTFPEEWLLFPTIK